MQIIWLVSNLKKKLVLKYNEEENFLSKFQFDISIIIFLFFI